MSSIHRFATILLLVIANVSFAQSSISTENQFIEIHSELIINKIRVVC